MQERSKVPTLAIFEVKFGDGAMAGSAGIVKHFADIEKFIDDGKLPGLFDEVQTQYNQSQTHSMGKMSREIMINREKKEFITDLC